jgi:hypothetical protein
MSSLENPEKANENKPSEQYTSESKEPSKYISLLNFDPYTHETNFINR